MEQCINLKLKGDLLVICCDCNFSLESSQEIRGTGTVMQSIGTFGLKHRNKAGIRLLTFIEISKNNYHLILEKKCYTTWRHPRSKLPHKIVYMLTEKTGLCRFVDVDAVGLLLNSDHLTIKYSLRILSNCRKRCTV